VYSAQAKISNFVAERLWLDVVLPKLKASNKCIAFVVVLAVVLLKNKNQLGYESSAKYN
jgi:hypothetical protein